MHARRLALVSALLVLAATFAAPPAAAIDRCVGVACVIDTPVVQTALGDRHQCFLLADGDVVCSGSDDAGQAKGRRQQDAVAIAAGPIHTCVLLLSGNVDCFGIQFAGRAAGYLGGDAVAIDTAERHTCAVLRSGNVECWGQNGWMANADWRHGGVVDVDLTTYDTCALFADGNVDCWGTPDGTFGFDYRYDGGDAVAIGGGDQHTCVVTSAGNVRCWGTSAGVVPYDGGDAVAVDGGYDATCILTTAGDVVCQGRNVSEDGTCGLDWMGPGPARCEGLEMGRDRRARDDGRVRSMTLTVYGPAACYVLDDGTAECPGALVPFVDVERDGENELELPSRGVALENPVVASPPMPVDRDTRIFVPVRVCPPFVGTCVGYVDVDPGVGPIDTEVPGFELAPPVKAGLRVAPLRAAVDPSAPGDASLQLDVDVLLCHETTCAPDP